MKKVFAIINIFIFLLFTSYLSADDVDVTKKPNPMKEKDFQFPKYGTQTLSNGLKVFVIEDHEQPTINIRLLIAGGKSLDTLKPGTAKMMADLLTKGTKNLSALEISQKLDGVGATISTNVASEYITINAWCLKKHEKLVFDILSDVLLNPTFPEDELEKLIPQALASIRQEKSNPRAVASKMARRVIYGQDHPLSLFPTEETIKKITSDDIEDFYKNYIKPNISSIAIIGDVQPKNILKIINAKFGKWEKSEKDIKISLPPIKPMPLGLYFIERPGSVQSSIMVTSLGVPYSSRNFEALDMAAGVIGAGFAGRLFKTLRETYSYTYTPFGYLTKGKYYGRFVCGADVRNNVSDSALTETLNQLNILSKNPPSIDELNRVKRYKTGSYMMSFENSGFTASLIQNADFYNIPIASLENYPKKAMSISPYEITDLANRYMNPKKSYIIVVGSPKIKDKLTSFGKIYDYDLNLVPLSGEKGKFEEVDFDAEELLEKYTDAIGGQENIDSIHTIIDTAMITMNNNGSNLKGKFIQYQMQPDKKHFILDMGVFVQEAWIYSDSVWTKFDTKIELESDNNAEQYLYDAKMFPATKLIKMNYKCKVLGKQKNAILMKTVSPRGASATYYFDADSFLLTKIERVTQTAQGNIPVTEYFKNYIKINGVLLPEITETINPIYTINNKHKYLLNKNIEEGIFSPKH